MFHVYTYTHVYNFSVKCGVRQGGVLSPYLFSLHVDDVINDVRKSGYGIYVGNVFTGCILYAYNIILISCSYSGLQEMVNICAECGTKMDIRFNSAKSHCISFGGCHSPAFSVLLNGCVIQWADKIKYLGCFYNENCHVDYTAGIQKFYGNFNNILSILGRSRNEMSAVHLTVSYCVPSLLYGCELWTLTSSAYHKMNVIWNNAFRKNLLNAVGVKMFCAFYITAKYFHCHIELINGKCSFYRK